MPSVFTSVTELLHGDEHRSALAAALGTDEQFIDPLVAAITPNLLAALAHRATRPGGAVQVHTMVEMAERSGPTDLMPTDRHPAVGGRLLQSLYGPAWWEIAPQLARRAGVSSGLVTLALPELLPVVLDSLVPRRRAGRLTPVGLGLLLQGEVSNLRRDGLLGVDEPPMPPAPARALGRPEPEVGRWPDPELQLVPRSGQPTLQQMLRAAVPSLRSPLVRPRQRRGVTTG